MNDTLCFKKNPFPVTFNIVEYPQDKLADLHCGNYNYSCSLISVFFFFFLNLSLEVNQTNTLLVLLQRNLKAQTSVLKTLVVEKSFNTFWYSRIQQCCGIRFNLKLGDANLKQAYLVFNLHNSHSEQMCKSVFQKQEALVLLISTFFWMFSNTLLNYCLWIFKVSLHQNSFSWTKEATLNFCIWTHWNLSRL